MNEIEVLFANVSITKILLNKMQGLCDKIFAMHAEALSQHQSACNAYNIAAIKQREFQLNQNPKQEKVKCSHCQLTWIAIYPELCDSLQCPGCGQMTKLFDDILYQ